MKSRLLEGLPITISRSLGAKSTAKKLPTKSEKRKEEITEIKNFQEKKAEVKSEKEKNILPLFIDLSNPSPDLGWANQERESLIKRGPADLVMALALVHHLAISNNLPLENIAEFLTKIGKNIILPFKLFCQKILIVDLQNTEIFINIEKCWL